MILKYQNLIKLNMVESSEKQDHPRDEHFIVKYEKSNFQNHLYQDQERISADMYLPAAVFMSL